MEEKINALKTSSKVISVIAKIGYTVMAVATGICTAMLIFLAITGGETPMFTIGKTNIVFFDELASTPAELMSICAVLFVVSFLFFIILLITYKMFHKISQTGEPFTEKYVKSVRAIGILIAVTPFATGIVEFIVTIIIKTDMPELFSDLPGVVIGAIIFCLSYIIDYGCGLNKKLTEDSENNTEK